jgi:transcription initiation factor TFIIIB Brf1 subunit/transcription initiation factor TFIIB
MNSVENMHFVIDPNKYEGKNLENLVWDYKSGTIIDATSGEVVGEILYADSTMGFRNLDKEEESFEHYGVLRQRIRLTSNQKRVWGEAWMHIVTSGLDVDPYLLARVVRRVFSASNKAPTAVKVAVAVVVALRMSGKPADVREVCRDLELEEKCDMVYAVIMEMFREGVTIPAENRYAKVLKMIEQFPDREVAMVAQRLLKYAKIDGKASTSVASTLVYIAGLLLGKQGATMQRAAQFYSVSKASIRNNYRRILPITVVQNKAKLVSEIRVPKKMCRELEEFQLSPKVVCE